MDQVKSPITIGCCGFAESQDKYFVEFPAIEIQQTFYQPPEVETARRWREKAPADFEFALKAWQLITHAASSPTYRRLRTPLSEKAKKRAGAFQPTDEVWQAWETTREIAEALQARFIIFQCPASFEPSTENQSNLRRFFKKIACEKFHDHATFCALAGGTGLRSGDSSPLAGAKTAEECIDRY